MVHIQTIMHVDNAMSTRLSFKFRLHTHAELVAAQTGLAERDISFMAS